MEPLSFLEKSKLPYSLLLDPVTDRAAAYTNNHQLVSEDASPALLQYAREHLAHQAAYEPALRDPHDRWRPLPPWASPDVLARAVLVWIARPHGDDDEAWRAIPPR